MHRHGRCHCGRSISAAHSSKNILFDGISRQAASSWADIKESNELGKSECFWQSGRNDAPLMLCQRYKLIMLRARPGPQPARNSIWKSGTLSSICYLFCSEDRTRVRWLDRHNMTAASKKTKKNPRLHCTSLAVRPNSRWNLKHNRIVSLFVQHSPQMLANTCRRMDDVLYSPVFLNICVRVNKHFKPVIEFGLIQFGLPHCVRQWARKEKWEIRGQHMGMFWEFQNVFLQKMKRMKCGCLVKGVGMKSLQSPLLQHYIFVFTSQVRTSSIYG